MWDFINHGKPPSDVPASATVRGRSAERKIEKRPRRTIFAGSCAHGKTQSALPVALRIEKPPDWANLGKKALPRRKIPPDLAGKR